MKLLTLIFPILISFNLKAEESNSVSYSFSVAYEKSFQDGVLQIRKFDEHGESIKRHSPIELLTFLKNHDELLDSFKNATGLTLDDLSKLDKTRKEITFSDINLFKELKGKFSLNEKINIKSHNGCHSSPKISLSSWDEPATEALDIKSGEKRVIPAGSVLHYTKVNLDENAILEINNGRQTITKIKSDGDCIINGSINSKKFRSGTGGDFSETSPDGEVLSVHLQETNKGGRGGSGGFGSYKSCIGYPSPIGGSGSIGTTQFGGGGGGSGYVTLVAVSKKSTKTRCEGYKGYDSTNQQGGKSDGPSAYGGNGGGRTPQRNGGYLFLKCDGKIIFSKTSKLDFSGESGVAGEDGGDNCGGGGGGGPGGQGGVLFVNKPFSDFGSNINFAGGVGGAEGKKGKEIQHCGSGENGKQGEAGYSGNILSPNVKLQN